MYLFRNAFVVVGGVFVVLLNRRLIFYFVFAFQLLLNSSRVYSFALDQVKSRYIVLLELFYFLSLEQTRLWAAYKIYGIYSTMHM